MNKNGGRVSADKKGNAKEAKMNGITVTVVQRHKKEGSQVWYARVKNTKTGSVRYVSLKTTRRTEAQLLANDMLREGEFDEKDEKSATTLGEGLEQYEKYLRNKGTAEISIETYRNVFRRFSGMYGVPIAEIKAEDVLDTFNEQFSEFSANFYNNARVAIKSAFNYFLNVLEIVPRNTARKIPKRKVQKKEKKFWTMEQIAAILDKAPNSNYRLLWAFMAYEGLRIHEALKVKPEDIRDGFLHVIGKGAKYAKIPIGSIMKSELDRAGWAWDFSRFSRQSCISAVHSCAKKALGDAFDGEATNHRFRHSFASNLVRAGANILVVQKLMRHATITMTLGTYSHLMDGDLESGIEKLSSK